MTDQLASLPMKDQNILAWLGYWRDRMPPEAVAALQEIVIPAPPAPDERDGVSTLDHQELRALADCVCRNAHPLTTEFRVAQGYLDLTAQLDTARRREAWVETHHRQIRRSVLSPAWRFRPADPPLAVRKYDSLDALITAEIAREEEK